MKMTRFAALVAASALLLSSLSAPVMAQAGPGALVGTFPAQGNTFGATITGLAPAASATDFFTISGVAGKTIQVNRIYCDGVSTANAAAVVQLVKRSALDTSGTSTSPTKVAYNSAYGLTAGAVVKAYTANPTLGTAVGALATGELVTGPAAAATLANPRLTFDLSNQHIMLNSAAELLGLNANAQSLTTGAALNCSVEWTE